ncbi:M3 family metallopeptidase [Pseudomonas cremoricolorata]|uniref:M3 family metallopeptidase n=1 Tax=Pseudomonas cremoricolorata TaxID=157783 RepID=UPI0004187D9C|nr:M3 family metallopeptidase [Pseudomonas cremoricolorata]
MTDSPLPSLHGLFDYPSLDPDTVQQAFAERCVAQRSALATILAEHAQAPGWSTLVAAVEALDQQVQDLFHSLVPLAYEGEQWAVSIDNCYQQLRDWEQHKYQSAELHQAYLALDDAALEPAQRVLLARILQDFQRNGAALAPLQCQQLQQTDSAIAALEQQFLVNLDNARDAWSLLLDDNSRLVGVPEAEQARLAARAHARGDSGWLIELNGTTVETLLRWADERDLREQVYRAQHSLACDLGTDPQLDNGPVLAALLRLRHERAQLLGAEDAMALSLRGKDATGQAEVEGFLTTLLDDNRPRLQADLEALQAEAMRQGLDELQPWDVTYLSRCLDSAEDDQLDARLRQGFPLESVLEGLYALYERLFGLNLTPVETAAWQTDVQALQVSEAGVLLGHIYLDAYERPGKAAWPYSYPMRARHVLAQGSASLPLALISCSFERPLAGASAHLTHLDLCKLFHEFGHALHQVLAGNDDRRLNRIDVATLGADHAEFVGTLLEQWCWSAPTLELLHHPEPGAPAASLQDFEQWLVSKRRWQAVDEARRLRRAWFDVHAHSGSAARHDLRALAVAANQEAGLPEAFAQERFAESFDYLVTGYDAGYYCYAWAQAHAIDAFTRFEQAPAEEAALGRHLRQEILSQGAVRSMTASFEAFMGRPLSLQAYAARRGSA